MAGFTAEIPYKVSIPGKTLKATHWQLASDDRMENLLVDEVSEVDLYFKRFNLPLDNNTYYYLRYKFIMTDGSETEFSRPALVTKDNSGTSIPDSVIKTPQVDIDANTTDVPLDGFVITCSPFEVLLGSGNHFATDWIIEDVNGDEVFKKLNDKSNLTSLRVPTGYLKPNNYYVIKVRYRSDRNVYSNFGKLGIVTNEVITGCGEDIGDDIQNMIFSLTNAFITLQNKELELEDEINELLTSETS